MNREKEESDASPFQPINAVEEAVSEKVHGDAMNVPTELAEITREATVSHGKKPRRERGRRHAHHGDNRGRIRLGF